MTSAARAPAPGAMDDLLGMYVRTLTQF